jgi:hypothetical protein
MIKHILQKASIITISFLFVGCTSSTFNVTHNINDKTTMIDLGNKKVYKIEDSTLISKTQGSKSILSSQGGISNYSSTGVCNVFSFYKLPELGNHQYYTSYAKEDIYKKYKTVCSTEIINNLEFHTCGSDYSITHEELSINEGDLISKSYLFIYGEVCFNKIKKFAKE